MPVQSNQAALAGINATLRKMEQTLREILSRVPPTSESASRPVPPK
jgi:hypothetical protein